MKRNNTTYDGETKRCYIDERQQESTPIFIKIIMFLLMALIVSVVVIMCINKDSVKNEGSSNKWVSGLTKQKQEEFCTNRSYHVISKLPDEKATHETRDLPLDVVLRDGTICKMYIEIHFTINDADGAKSYYGSVDNIRDYVYCEAGESALYCVNDYTSDKLFTKKNSVPFARFTSILSSKEIPFVTIEIIGQRKFYLEQNF